jgi:hypothetical protein
VEGMRINQIFPAENLTEEIYKLLSLTIGDPIDVKSQADW